MENGLGLGFYYSLNQDRTFPDGNGGSKVNEQSDEVGFDYYFRKKCKPQGNQDYPTFDLGVVGL